MDKLKQNFEKLILAIAMLVMGYVAFNLYSDADEQQTKIQDQVQERLAGGKGKKDWEIDMSPYTSSLTKLDNAQPLTLSNPHNLFNPVQWRKTPQGTIFKVEQGNQAGTYQIPSEPGVLVLGKGQIDHYGLNVMLGGDRAAYGAASGSQVLGGGVMQWHIDGAFYGYAPGCYTQMRCIEAPEGEGHWWLRDNLSQERYDLTFDQFATYEELKSVYKTGKAEGYYGFDAVSYTHLTLPTNREV